MAEAFTILIVDDNPNNLFTMRTLLARLPDCELVEASSGEEALMRTIETDIHLILLDVQMPGMDGFETARHLLMTERTRNIPIIFVTAIFKSEDFVAHGYKLGAVDYLVKPLDDNLLLNRVRLYQRLRQHERELETKVSQLQIQELALQLARDAAESANQAKNVFLANMSHELRTPLNAILGFAQLMERDSRIPEDERRNLAIICRSGYQLLSLINDVLELAHIENGGARVNFEAFDLAGMLAALETNIRSRAEEKNLGFVVECPPELPTFVMGDNHHLRQVLLNLLDNAIKYTDSGEIRLIVRIQPGKFIGFEVSDTGPGIAAKDRERIFNAFYQSKTSITKGEGAGLGLTISREFVRLMGGELTVKSAQGQGSRFSFSLPLPVAAVAPGSKALGRIAGLAEGQVAPLILIAEDHPESQQLLAQLLMQLGCEVCVAANGREAVDLFQMLHPKLILMDILMPEMDGYAATRAIRALDGGNELPIVALTASTVEEDRDSMLAAGCNEVLKKPVEVECLFEMIGCLLGLEFEYALPEKQERQSIKSEEGIATLNAIPVELRNKLADAAIALDIEVVQAIVDSWRAHYPKEVSLIDKLIADYSFDKIAVLCRECGSTHLN